MFGLEPSKAAIKTLKIFKEAKKIYPDGWKTIKPYLRKVPDPSK